MEQRSKSGHRGRSSKKLIEAAQWVYGKEGQSYCLTCRKAARQKKAQTKCEKGEECKNREPDLLPENQTIFECFRLCESQLRVGFGGAFALDWSVIIRIANDMDIETGRLFYILLRAFESVLIGNLNRKESKT